MVGTLLSSAQAGNFSGHLAELALLSMFLLTQPGQPGRRPQFLRMEYDPNFKKWKTSSINKNIRRPQYLKM